MSILARRLDGNPIVARGLSASLGANINGPSLVAAPPWLDAPLGRYYLYFAHHRGTHIRLATAERLDGPWSVYEPGTLRLDQSHFPTTGRRPHIASPDVHVDPGSQTVRMYFHGLLADGRRQASRVALSGDGIHFESRPELLGRAYLRVFRHGEGAWYALAKPGILYRSPDGLGAFERGPALLSRDMRHGAVLVDGGELLVFWSRIGDMPERILLSRVSLADDWQTWRAGPAEVVLEPELPWEGVGLPLRPSRAGWVDEPVCELRDPAVYREGDRTYLLYAVAGESGIAIAELQLRDDDAVPAGAGRLVRSYPDPTPPVRAGREGAATGARVGRDARIRSASERVLVLVNRRAGSDYRLGDRLGGELGSFAFLVEAPGGSRAVLRWSPERSDARCLEAAAAAVAAARAWGWPTPAWLASGTTPSGYPYRLEEVAWGAPPVRLDLELANAALSVVDRQAGRAPITGRDWSRLDRGFVVEASATLRAVAALSDSGRRFGETLAAWVEPYRTVALPGGDLVHGDLRAAHIRLDGGRIAALLDAEGVGCGSRLHDVATLLVDVAAAGEQAATDRLVAYARAGAVRGEFEISLTAGVLARLRRHLEAGSAVSAIDAVSAAIGRVIERW